VEQLAGKATVPLVIRSVQNNSKTGGRTMAQYKITIDTEELQYLFNQALCQYLAGIFPRSRQINLKPPLTIAWDQPGTT
jgi:hypothetical protein